jgi:predicted MFS family arabinose efflux permease
VLSLGLLALGAPTPAFLLDQHLPWLLVLSGVRGAGFAVLTVVGAVLAVRVAPASRHGEAIGVYGLAIAVPNLVAVPAGTALTLAGHFDVVAWLAAASLLALPLVPRLVRVSAEPAAQAAPERGDRWAAVQATIPPSIALLVVTLAGGGLLTFLPIARPDGVVAPVALLLFGATGAVARWRAGLLADRVGGRMLLPVALLASIAGLGGVAAGLAAATGSDALVLVSAAVFGAGFGATQNLTLVVAFARAGPAQVTTASAVWNGAFDAGTALGAVAVGAVAAGLGFPLAFVGCAIVVVAALPLAGTRGQGGTR